VNALPSAVARVSVEEELGAARAWASRHGWAIHWDHNGLLLRVATYHARASRLVEVTGQLDGYRAIPPAWRFVRPGTGETGKEWFPAAGPGSVFHGNIVICAPWNRLAYAEHGGPHGDWSGAPAWLQVSGTTIAHTIGDMLAAIDAHLRQSPGMMQ
jgi:hypothetical protein